MSESWRAPVRESVSAHSAAFHGHPEGGRLERVTARLALVRLLLFPKIMLEGLFQRTASAVVRLMRRCILRTSLFLAVFRMGLSGRKDSCKSPQRVASLLL